MKIENKGRDKKIEIYKRKESKDKGGDNKIKIKLIKQR